jgi:DnaJ-class molecular chaperone
MYEQAAAAGGPSGPQAGAWNVHFGGGPGGGFRTMTAEEMRDMFGDADPFSDFFHTFFGGATAAEADAGRRTRGPRGRVPRRGRDVEHEIELDLEEAQRGSTHRLALTHDGRARTVDVRIPAGIGEGSRVRIAGEGEHGMGGAPSGDLYLRIRLAPHPKYERKGRDLYVRVPVPLTTAVLGGEAEVATLGGKPLRLKIPPTTQNGQVFRLKGHGMPVAGKPEETGDLYATVDVELPRTLTPEQRSHFEALRKLA